MALMQSPVEVQLFFDHWHDFFLLAGTAAATLLGLLFVSLSLHLDLLVEPEAAYLRAMAIEAFFSFVVALFLSMMFLAPDVPARIHGLSGLMFGILRTGRAAWNIRHARGGDVKHYGKGLLIVRFVLPLLGGILIALGGYGLMHRDLGNGMQAIISGVFLLIGGAAGASWDLLMKVAHIKYLRRSS
jgi:Trk-type K+ transport system membrane component